MRSRSNGKILFKLLGVIAALAFIAYGIKDRSEITSIHCWLGMAMFGICAGGAVIRT